MNVRRSRPRATIAVVAACAATAACALGGCGGDGGSGDGRAATPPASTRTTPPGATVPGSPRPHRHSPPPIALTPGRGPGEGALARLVYTTSTFGQVPLGFAAGGIPAGTTAGDCRVSEISDDDRAAIETTARRQTGRGEVLPIGDDAILLADCGADGRWAIVTWTQRLDDGDTSWVDELRDDGGRWSGTARGVQPGCRMPRAAAAAFQIDVTVCPPPPQPRPRAQPRRDPPLGALPDGSSRA